MLVLEKQTLHRQQRVLLVREELARICEARVHAVFEEGDARLERPQEPVRGLAARIASLVEVQPLLVEVLM